MPLALLSLLLGPMNPAVEVQDPPSQLHLTEVISLDPSRLGIDFARIGGLKVTREGGFFVFDPIVQSLYLFDADGQSAREIGRRGEGPGWFVRGGTMLIGDGQMTIFDYGQSLLHTFTWDGEFVDAGRAPTVERATLQAAQELRGGQWVGVSQPSFTFRLAEGKIDRPGYVFASVGGGDEVQVLLEYVFLATIYYDKTHEVPYGPAPSGIDGHTGDWDLVGDSVVVVADWMAGVIDWYRVDAGGYELVHQIDTRIPAQPISEDDRRQVIELDESRGYVDRNAGWLFPERVPGIARMIADSQDFLWLQRYYPNDPSSPNWRVIAPGGDRWADVVLPVELEVKDIRNDRIYGVTTNAMDIPTIKVYAFDRSRLFDPL